MKRNIVWWLGMIIVGLFGVSGCQFPAATEAELDKGLVLLLGGIEGGVLSGGGLTMTVPRDGLKEGHVEQAVELYKWQHSVVPLFNLIDHRENEKSAADVIEFIEGYAKEHPGRPIDLVGYSGGGGIALMVAEGLPEEVRVRHIFLVHAAVSPRYDLTAAIEHIDGQIVNYHSTWDWFIGGVGTSMFGTIDRKFGVSAGMVGFDLDEACPDERLRNRIEQEPWQWSDLERGRWGGHMAIHQAALTRNYVAPMVREKD